MSKDRLNYMDSFRALAIILVVATHVSNSRVMFHLVYNATVFFIFIAGFFFAYLYRSEESSICFLGKKAERILYPYLVSAGVGILWCVIYQNFGFQEIFRSFVTGVGHLNDSHWFIPVILMCFSLHPLVVLIMRNELWLKWVSCITLLISLFTFRSLEYSNPFYLFIHFLGVFFLGIYFNSKRLKLEAIGQRYFWIIIGVCSVIFLWAYIRIPTNFSQSMEGLIANPRLMLNYTMVIKIVAIPPIIVILQRLEILHIKIWGAKLIAETSFGIYFWHGYVINLFYKFNLFTPIITQMPLWISGIQYLISVLMVTLISLLLLKWILGKRSFLLTGY